MRLTKEKTNEKSFTNNHIVAISYDSKLGKDNDKLFDFLKNIYNDVAKACNERYTGGKREMFMIIKEGYQK